MNQKHKERWTLEVDIMKRLDHPNVIAAKDVPPELNVHVGEMPLLAMEYCSGGDLRKVRQSSNNAWWLQAHSFRRTFICLIWCLMSVWLFNYGFHWLIGAEQARELCRAKAVWHQMSGERYCFRCRVPPQKENHTQRPQAWEHRATSHWRAGRQTELSYCKANFIRNDFILWNIGDKSHLHLCCNIITIIGQGLVHVEKCLCLTRRVSQISWKFLACKESCITLPVYDPRPWNWDMLNIIFKLIFPLKIPWINDVIPEGQRNH